MHLFCEGVKERENLLIEIENLCQYISRTGIKLHGELITKIVNSLFLLRMTTLKIFEAFIQLKTTSKKCLEKKNPLNLENNDNKNLLKIEKAGNYIKKTIIDLDYLFNSPLKEYFSFSKNHDPFLIFPSCNNQRKGIVPNKYGIHPKPYTKIHSVPLSKEAFRRINLCYDFLRENYLKDHNESKGQSELNLSDLIKDIIYVNDLNLANKLFKDPSNEYLHFPNLISYNTSNKTQKQNMSNEITNKLNSFDTIPNHKENKDKDRLFSNNLNVNLCIEKENIQKTQENNGDNNGEFGNEFSNLSINQRDCNIDRNNDFTILGLDMEENEILSFLSNYMNQLKSEMINSFYNNENLIQNSKNSRGSIWLYAKDKSGQIRGLCVLILENTQKYYERILILHLSSIKDHDFLPLTKKFIEFIWKNINCMEIRIAIHYIKVRDELTIYDLIKHTLDQTNFRWKSLNNNATEERIMIMGITKPNSISILNDLNLFYESISICSIHVLEIHNNIKEKITNIPKSNDYLSECSIVYALKAMINNELMIEQDPLNERKSKLISVASKINDKTGLRSSRFYSFKTCEELNKLLNEFNFEAFRIEGFKESEITEKVYLGIQSININFEAFQSYIHKINEKYYKYLRIE